MGGRKRRARGTICRRLEASQCGNCEGKRREEAGEGSHRTPALAFALKEKGKKPLESSEERSDRNSLEEFKEYSGCSLGTRVEGLQYSKSRSREHS